MRKYISSTLRRKPEIIHGSDKSTFVSNAYANSQILRNPADHHHAHENNNMVSILSQMKAVTTHTHPAFEEQSQYLTFLGPCIMIYFYNKISQMHNVSNLFYFGTTLYMFRTVFSSTMSGTVHTASGVCHTELL